MFILWGFKLKRNLFVKLNMRGFAEAVRRRVMHAMH